MIKFIEFLQLFKYTLIFYLTKIKVFIIHNCTKSKKVIFFLSTPRHGNLGDHAIVYSQYNLFKELGYVKNIVEISSTTFELYRNKIKDLVKNTDLIVIDGGGNIGTLWIHEEYIMRDIISTYKNNAIFIMPQTAYFEKTPEGISELQMSKDIYCRHPNLTIFCRDIDTYELLSKEFKTVKSYYVPDMVMFCSDVDNNLSRNGALLCFRRDIESNCSNEIQQSIIMYIRSKKIVFSNSSTVEENNIDMWQRKRALQQKWKEFSKAEFVVTDRLHGMVFAAITATPCLAIDNISHKVKNGYKWLAHLPYIKFCENNISILEKLAEIILLSKQEYYYDCEEIKRYYEFVKDIIKSEL